MRHTPLGTSVGLLLGLGCALVVLGLCVAGVDAVTSPGRTSAFDSEKWKANSGCSASNPRWHMRRDAEARLTPGLTREAVLELLGPPDAMEPDEMLYCLGFWSGLRMDPDHLHVWFDGTGRLASSAVLQH